VLPEGTAAEITVDSWPVLPVFDLLSRIGNVPEQEMYRTFNMGIGMVLILNAEDAGAVRENLNQRGEAHYEIGRVVEGARLVSLTR
jgi:phosphoribosylformylglycinamidine cyclo-ligase